MQMQVETFEQTEITAEGQEQAHDEEAIRLINDMELAGQKNLTVANITRCPYREMTINEQRVYETLYPQKSLLSEYRASMIPLRVLQVAAHAKSLGTYSFIQVWSERTRPTDPILVGLIGSEYSPKATHILARWGEALAPFKELYEKALEMQTQSFRVKLLKLKAQVEQHLAAPESMAIDHLNGEWVHLSL